MRLWRLALLIVQPETLLRWHRPGFALFWRRTLLATTSAQKPRVAAEMVALIQEMAAASHLWGC